MPHSYAIPAEYEARTSQRQGATHGVSWLDAVSTALVVVDMQRYFMEEPFAGACPVAQEVVPNVNAVAARLRATGGTVAWLQMKADSSDGSEWRSLRERYGEDAAKARWDALQPDARGFELWPDLDVKTGDLRIVKDRYSAFIPGSSDIDPALKNRGVDTLLVAGVATNACCESTARDAMMLGYRVVMVSDACAAATDEEHAAALNNFYLFFGDVQTTSEVVELL